jgi:hypothetical protein
MAHPRINRVHLDYAVAKLVTAMEQGLYGEVKFKFEDGIIQRGWVTEVSLPPNPEKKSRKVVDTEAMPM